MKMLSVLVLSFSGCLNLLVAQTNLYVGVHGGVDFDQWEKSNPSPYIGKTPILSSSFGFVLGTEINNNFSVESGIIRKYYYEGYSVTLNGSLGTTGIQSNSTTALQIPLRLKARVYAKKERLAFTGILGYHICFNSEFGFGGSGMAAISSETDSIVINEISKHDYSRTFALFEAGIGTEFYTRNKVGISLSLSYFSGFKTLSTLDLTYQVNKGAVEQMQLSSSGDYFAWHIGVRVPINAFKDQSPDVPIKTEFEGK